MANGATSQGGAVYLGAAVDDQPLWSGDLAVRYELRVYDDPGSLRRASSAWSEI